MNEALIMEVNGDIFLGFKSKKCEAYNFIKEITLILLLKLIIITYVLFEL